MCDTLNLRYIMFIFVAIDYFNLCLLGVSKVSLKWIPSTEIIISVNIDVTVIFSIKKPNILHNSWRTYVVEKIITSFLYLSLQEWTKKKTYLDYCNKKIGNKGNWMNIYRKIFLFLCKYSIGIDFVYFLIFFTCL